MDAVSKGCSQCGAINQAGAEWCTQCYARFPPVIEHRSRFSVDKGWACSRCGETNDVELSACATCGTSIFDAFAQPGDRRRMSRREVLVAGLLWPGHGLARVGLPGHGSVAGILATAALATGVMLLFTETGVGAGALLVVLGLVVWAASVRDALLVSQGRRPEILLRPRILTVLGALVIGAIMLAIVVAFNARGGGV